MDPQSCPWEVMDDLQQMDLGPTAGSRLDLSIPEMFGGYLLMKRCKYPYKGWHKKYFVLEMGILKYSKSRQDFKKEKIHGSQDVSLAVLSIKAKSKRITLDDGNNIFHLKAESHDIFSNWLTQLCAHRLFRKKEAMRVHHGILHMPSTATISQTDQSMMPSVVRRTPSVLDSFSEYFDAIEEVASQSSLYVEALSEITTTSKSEAQEVHAGPSEASSRPRVSGSASPPRSTTATRMMICQASVPAAPDKRSVPPADADNTNSAAVL